jgi:ferredoxin--NADP+ reductase
VVGAGPAGFYATDELLRAGFTVDLFDALPTPFGLVRAGVAPDHPRIKSVTRVFDRTASSPGFRFFGGVEVGADLTRSELLERYAAVVYAVGTELDTRLGIPGEDLRGSHPASHFVSWYNGHPAHAARRFALDCDSAVVVGNGNVALDVARLLVLDPTALSATDTADHALEALAGARVRRVTVLGRRGPAQAAFTTPELRELGELPGIDVTVDPGDLDREPLAAAVDPGDAAAMRRLELLRSLAERPPTDARHRIDLRFLRSPVAVVGDPTRTRVAGLRVVRNRLEKAGGRVVPVPTGEEEVLDCGLVIRAVGYRGRPLPGVPFDEVRGLVPNRDGRVVDSDGRPMTGEYVAGWIKRGPSGVIGTNKSCAADTVAAVVADAAAGRLNTPASGSRDVASLLAGRVSGLVGWAGWQAIDEHERERGRPAGRPRVKLVAVDELTAVAAGATS